MPESNHESTIEHTHVRCGTLRRSATSARPLYGTTTESAMPTAYSMVAASNLVSGSIPKLIIINSKLGIGRWRDGTILWSERGTGGVAGHNLLLVPQRLAHTGRMARVVPQPERRALGLPRCAAMRDRTSHRNQPTSELDPPCCTGRHSTRTPKRFGMIGAVEPARKRLETFARGWLEP